MISTETGYISIADCRNAILEVSLTYCHSSNGVRTILDGYKLKGLHSGEAADDVAACPGYKEYGIAVYFAFGLSCRVRCDSECEIEEGRITVANHDACSGHDKFYFLRQPAWLLACAFG